MTEDLRHRPGRRAIQAESLRPDGMTVQQEKLLKRKAKELGISYASLKRMVLSGYLSSLGFSDQDQGLITKDWEAPRDNED